MNWFGMMNSLRQIWDDQPNIIALFALGLAVFVYVVLDARRCRHRDKHRHPPKY